MLKAWLSVAEAFQSWLDHEGSDSIGGMESYCNAITGKW